MSEPTVVDRATRRAAVARRRRLVLLSGAAVLAIAAVVVVVLLATGGSDDGATLKGPTTSPAGSAPQDTTAAGGNSAEPLKTGVCSAQQLTGTRTSSGIKGQSQVAVIALTNGSGTRCTLSGAPEIVIAGDGGDQPTVVTVGGGAVRADLVAQEVTLEPGAQASFVASWAPVAGPGSGDSGCSKGTALEVTLPESKGTVKVDMLMTACAGGALNVSPIQPDIVKP